jgi:hypothetical protein
MSEHRADDRGLARTDFLEARFLDSLGLADHDLPRTFSFISYNNVLMRLA